MKVENNDNTEISNNQKTKKREEKENDIFCPS